MVTGRAAESESESESELELVGIDSSARSRSRSRSHQNLTDSDSGVGVSAAWLNIVHCTCLIDDTALDIRFCRKKPFCCFGRMFSAKEVEGSGFLRIFFFF